MSESRNFRSVSDLYAADEIEVLLLEEIRDLEPSPATYSRLEDIQDFEIAGSRTGERISTQSSEIDSPVIHSTIHSWDSHVHYHGGYGKPGNRSSAPTMSWPQNSHVIFFCDIQGHLKTATGLVRLLLLLSSAACLATLCSSGTAKVSLFMLPLMGRLRFMIFVAVFCFLITSLLLFLDISRVVFFFPFNWSRVNTWIFTSVGLSYTTSSVLIVLSVIDYGTSWIPRQTRSQLTITATLGLSCACLSFILSWLHGRNNSRFTDSFKDNKIKQLYKPIVSSLEIILKDETLSKQPTAWLAKDYHKNKLSLAENNGNKKRKSHWASTRSHHLVSNRLDKEIEDLRGDTQKIVSNLNNEKSNEFETHHCKSQHHQKQNVAEEVSRTISVSDHIKTIERNIEEKKKVQPKKLSIHGTDKPRLRGQKESATKKSTRTSVTRSEIQEYWMQGYDHVQRTEKTTANIEQWQSAAMKSLEEKKVKDAQWAEIWQQKKEHNKQDLELQMLKNEKTNILVDNKFNADKNLRKNNVNVSQNDIPAKLKFIPSFDHIEPCSSKNLNLT